MARKEFKNFYNDGFGYTCKDCERNLRRENIVERHQHGRFMREGEAESKELILSGQGLAKWLDVAQTTLICPTCGVSEMVK